ncbi:MAG: hypothetical protein A3H28_05100 [Acidobacteria bacterium RIFCSPLOWO2_02_FULL_61_28]|nr:MAG: hypothetical protein A3H28_05100 [Acidobacteria bacterium RIFCSPLOWO2_02_FULL_61_28]
MAEGLLRRLVPPGVGEVVSAGTDPKPVQGDAIRILAEIGVDISAQRSKPLEEFLGQEFDYAITLCDEAQQACPAFPGAARRLHWSLPDPAAAQGTDRERMAVFRTVRNELAARIEGLMEGLLDRFLLKAYEESA